MREFEKVYRLIRSGRLSSAERLLLGSNGTRIQAPFDSDLNHAWYVAGDIRYRRGQMPGAVAAFRRALRHWPDDQDAMMAIANCYSELGRPRWSAYYLEKALRFRGRNPELFYNLGNAYFDLRDFPKAIQRYRSASRRADGELKASCQRNLALARKSVPARRSMLVPQRPEPDVLA
jgi:tetratricopeptide (TPR) repeat protein